jgi:NAD(P)-dependent dehydrogenase (short-subunit alcohol dehydrogenase family)
LKDGDHVKPETILVSGAGRGLGFCIAKRHLLNGDIVHVIIRKFTEPVTKLTALYPGQYFPHLGDVSKTALLEPALKEIRCQTVCFDIIYNVAAIFWEKDRCGLQDLDIDNIPDMISVNTCGTLRVLKGLHNQIMEHTRIINVSSESGSIQNCMEKEKYSYNISKAALNMATKLYYNENEGKRKIISVCPGWMRTEMGGEIADLDPNFSAEKIIYLAKHMNELDPDTLFFKYDGRKLPW